MWYALDSSAIQLWPSDIPNVLGAWYQDLNSRSPPYIFSKSTRYIRPPFLDPFAPFWIYCISLHLQMYTTALTLFHLPWTHFWTTSFEADRFHEKSGWKAKPDPYMPEERPAGNVCPYPKKIVNLVWEYCIIWEASSSHLGTVFFIIKNEYIFKIPAELPTFCIRG